MNAKTKSDMVTIKKYANRRLYDTETSMYITLDDLAKRVKSGQDFTVIDAKSGQDLTRQVLTQIILERELQGDTLLPVNFLRGVIGLYDDKIQGVLQPYLDASMKAFLNNQERMRGMIGKAPDGFSPFTPFEEITRQNVAIFEKAFSMFSPFGNYFAGQPQEEEVRQAQPAAKQRSRRAGS